MDVASSEESDTRELAHLNNQIKLLKSRMLMKGDELNKLKNVKTATKNNCDDMRTNDGELQTPGR